MFGLGLADEEVVGALFGKSFRPAFLFPLYRSEDENLMLASYRVCQHHILMEIGQLVHGNDQTLFSNLWQKHR